MASDKPTDPGSNWAGNYKYKAKELYRPRNVEEIQALIKTSDKLKALGSRHCFNDVADSSSVLISTEHLDQIIDIDENSMTVAMESGVRYGRLCPILNTRGYALHNLASLPHISVVGACSTATHGSGIKNGNLATAVAGLEFVSGTGDLIAIGRSDDDEKLNGAVVNLGALGVVTKITLDIQRKFSVRQNAFQDLALWQLKRNFEEIMSSGYSVSLFTNWQDRIIDQIWIKRRIDDGLTDIPNDFFGAKRAIENLHPISGISAENCTEQMGVAGDWYQRLPHFKMDFTPSSGEELQSEYFVPMRNAVDAISAIENKRELVAPHLLISEIRTIAADDLWMSPCYRNACIAFHFTWKKDMDAIRTLLPIIEGELAPYKARPHWGKLFTTSPEVLYSIYERMQDFIELMKEFDPSGKFRNRFLEKYIFRSPL